MTNLYQKLGIDKTATKAELKSAYRSLAKKYHPDHNKDDKKTAERFKEVSAAYHILGDDEKREKYDRGELDENGNERPPMGAGGFGGRGARPGGFGGGGFRSQTSQTDFSMEDAEDLFSQFFRFNSRGPGSKNQESQNPYANSARPKGLDINYEITIGFEEAITGSTRRLKLNDSRNVDIKIPAGIHTGQVIRLSGQGGPGVSGSPKGDALIEIRVAPHPYYRREGNDIHLELPISLDEAVLGGDIQVPTPSGRLTIRIPRNSSSGKRLRLKGKGVKKKNTEDGNMYVTLKVVLPEDRDPELEKLMKQWPAKGGDTIRKKAGLN
ncbi:DnaJ C-terminal domain-containing protein [Kordiimonas pumila]|uniref:DnaJ C-terminal domain-containing protein n=1 Tax=Kordiimonas pumila TaxID=2161677 RepID=A0ABV7D1P9_9PROT|nr:DnaJ C-terminal domain-containing protein [Kordiimonas pumila]